MPILSQSLSEYRSTEKNKLIASLVLTSLVMVLEFAGGLLTGSIALVSDAAHMFTHALAVAIGLIAILMARRPLCHHRTFGLFRAEILGAFVNGLFLLAVAAAIIHETVLRMRHPQDIQSAQMLWVAFVGLAANLASIAILHGSHRHDLNVKSVFFHMISDAASSVGVIAAAVIIMRTGWNFIDPLVSLLISFLIVLWSWNVLKESVVILLEMAPRGLNVDVLTSDLKTRFPEIEELDHVHIWALTASMFLFSAHVRLRRSGSAFPPDRVLKRIDRYLRAKYRIVETTLQILS